MCSLYADWSRCATSTLLHLGLWSRSSTGEYTQLPFAFGYRSSRGGKPSRPTPQAALLAPAPEATESDGEGPANGETFWTPPRCRTGGAFCPPRRRFLEILAGTAVEISLSGCGELIATIPPDSGIFAIFVERTRGDRGSEGRGSGSWFRVCRFPLSFAAVSHFDRSVSFALTLSFGPLLPGLAQVGGGTLDAAAELVRPRRCCSRRFCSIWRLACRWSLTMIESTFPRFDSHVISLDVRISFAALVKTHLLGARFVVEVQ